MTPEKQIYAYRIPDSFFLPHTVKSPFYAKVTYSIEKGRAKIEEVGLSTKCLLHINNTCGMVIKIENELDAAIKKAISLNNVNKIVASALAPHI